jgi:hypothetical protein
MMMEAGSTFETSVNFYQTTRCNISEDRLFVFIWLRIWASDGLCENGNEHCGAKEGGESFEQLCYC